ncbi:MAG TPA: hypothetical protein VIV57_00225 [Anaeromyxobacter sp.]
MIRLAAALAALALSAPLAAAQEQRPSEEELFGAPAKEEKPPAPPKEAPSGASAGEPAKGDRDQEMFGSTGSPNAVPPPPQGIITREKEDPLRVGGMLYLRSQLVAQQDASPGDWRLASPNLLDVFLDARPNDRVRAFALGRLSYDPTLDGAASFQGLPPSVVQQLGLTQANPRGNLDQLWVNFDVGRTVFVTAGKQHVKWGVGRLWTPSDFLHREPRNPLDPFDARTGVTMVKAHLPWEARGWNAYGVALLEDPRYGGGTAAGTAAGVPVGGRGEIVLGTVEIGADVLAGKGARTRYGVDVSAGVWDFDMHAEAAFGAGRARWRLQDPAAPIYAGRYVLEQPDRLSPQVVVGGTWVAKYSDEDAVTVGAEYFFQDAGYEDPHVYPFLFFGAPLLQVSPGPPPTASLVRQDPAAFTSFHLGRHYAGAFVLLPSPGSWNDTSFTLSVLANLSDKSAVIRLDHSVLVLTYLRVETFVQGHVGAHGGEFRFAFDVPPEIASALGAQPFGVKAPVVDVGLALRVSL